MAHDLVVEPQFVVIVRQPVHRAETVVSRGDTTASIGPTFSNRFRIDSDDVMSTATSAVVRPHRTTSHRSDSDFTTPLPMTPVAPITTILFCRLLVHIPASKLLAG